MEIKPCPFCGESPNLYPKFPEVEGDAWGEVRCMNPKCPAQPSVLDGIKVNDDRGTIEYQKAAIKRWNTRPSLKNLT